ncbi:MAG: ABC transporter substrate-binding protein [Methylovirgula sp.]
MDTIGLLVKPSDHVTIHWVPVQPQLFAPLLLRGQVDGLSGFVNSMLPAAVQAGFKESDLATLRYSQFGVNSYGLALVTTKALAQSDPDLVKRVVKAINRALVETKASPEAALQYLLARDPLLNPDIERLRLKLALELIDTPDAEKIRIGLCHTRTSSIDGRLSHGLGWRPQVESTANLRGLHRCLPASAR